MRNAVILIAILTGILLAGCGLEGTHMANPTTTIRIDPLNRTMEFSDNKDNDVQIEELEYNGTTKTFKAKKIAVVNNASKVRESSAVQLQQLALQTQAIMVGLQNMANALVSVFPTGKAVQPITFPTIPAATTTTVAPPAVKSEADAVPATEPAP